MPYIHEGNDLYLNADKSKIVPENSPEAAYLLVSRGGTLSDEDAERYGLLSGLKKLNAFSDPESTRGTAVNPPVQYLSFKGLQPRDLAPGEMLQEARIARAGDLSPDTQVIVVEGLHADDAVEVVKVEEQPTGAESGEQIDGQGLEPAIEFTPSAAFEEQVNASGQEDADVADQDEGEGEKAKEAKPNKAKGPPTNKAG